MPQINYSPGLRRAKAFVVFGLLAFAFLVPAAFGQEAGLQGKLNKAEGFAQVSAEAARMEIVYPDDALSILSNANQAVDLAKELTQEAKMQGNGELAIQSVEVIDQVAEPTRAVVDQAPSPISITILESALNISETSAEALLTAAEMARDTGNTELALAVVEAGGTVDGIINTILQIATENANLGLVTAAIAAEGPMSETIRVLAGHAKTAGNPALAQQAVGVAENHPAVLEQAYQLADSFSDPALAGRITQVLENYTAAILAVAQLAETSQNRELGQLAVNEAYLLATTLCRTRPIVEYAISVGDDSEAIQAWEAILTQIQEVETLTGEAMTAGVAAGAASPGRPPCAPGPGSWWREPLLEDTRIAEDEEPASPMRP